MPKGAIQTTSRMLHKCPSCGTRSLKEMVADGTSTRLLAHCPECHAVYAPKHRSFILRAAKWLLIVWLAAAAIGILFALLSPAH